MQRVGSSGVRVCRAKHSVLALAAVALSVASQAACSAQPKVLEAPSLKAGDRKVQYQHGAVLMALKSGLRLLVLPDASTNVVRLDVRYMVGSMADPAGRSGLAHLVEHLTYEARPSGSQRTIGQLLGESALYNNAYTSWDSTQYTAVAMSEEVGRLMSIEAARMKTRCEQIDDALFQREREVVRNELRQRSTMSLKALQLLVRDVYGAKHPYSASLDRSDEALAAITRDDVCAFLSTHYQPGNAILVLSGNIDLEVAKNLFGRSFRKLKGTPVEKTRPPDVARLRGTESEHSLPISEATALIAYHAPPFTSENSAYERIAHYLLARKLWPLRKNNKAITNIQLRTTGAPRAPLVVIEVSVSDPAKLRSVVARIQDKTRDLLDEVNNDVLGHTKERVRAEFLSSLEPFASEANLFLDYLHYSNHLDYAMAELRQYDRMSRSDFADYLETRFNKNESHVVYLTPGSNAQPTAQRAALTFSPSDHELPDWRASVDVSEADRDLPLTGAKLRPEPHSFQLKNGLNVLLVPELGHPVVDIRLVFRGGTLHEPADKPGLARWAAELLEFNPESQFRKTVNLPIALRVVQAIFRMGGTVENHVDELTTTFRVAGLSMYADGLLWQLYQDVATGRYSAKTLALYRDQWGRSRALDEKQRQRRQLLLEAVFGAGHPYARPTIEYEELQALTIDDLNRFRAAHHQTDQATLIITGEFDEAFLRPQIKRLFGTLPKRAARAPTSVDAVPRRTEPTYLAAIDDSAAQLTISIAFPTAAGQTHKLAERLVLRNLLQLELDGLRERLGASYGVQVAAIRRVGPGMLVVEAAVDSQRALESFRALQDALKRVRQGDVRPAFVRARRAVLQELLADVVNSDTVASQLETVVAHGQPEDLFADVARAVAKMRLADVQKLAASDLVDARSAVLLVGREAVITKLLQGLTISAATTDLNP